MNKNLKRIAAVLLLACIMLTGCMTGEQGAVIDSDKSHQVLVPATSSEKSRADEYMLGDTADITKAAEEESTDAGSSFDVREYLAAKKNGQNNNEDDDIMLDLFETDGEEDRISEPSETAVNNTSDSSVSNADSANTDSTVGTVSTADTDPTGNTDSSADTDSADTAGKSATSTYANTGTGPVNTAFNDTEHIFDYSTFHFDEDTFDELAPTVHMDFAELIGDNGDYTFPEGYPEAGTYRIVVDIYHQVVIVFTKDDDGKYTVPVRYMLCSSGGDNSPSPLGTFKMRSYRVRFGLFRNTDSYAQYWSLISGRIYFHTTLYDAHDGSTYTDSYKDLGTNCSHGCIRLTVPDARWIWYNCAPETVVEIRKGSKKEKEIDKIRKRLILAAYPEKRLNLKPENIPMTDNWRVEDIPHDVEFVQGSQE